MSEARAPEEALSAARPAGIAEVLQIAAGAMARGVAVVLVTVLDRSGSAPSTPGQKIVACADGTCAGTVGGGALEHAVLRQAQAALGDPAAVGPRTVTLALGPELGMCCGGSVTVLLEAMAAPSMIGIVGAGHVATALVPLLLKLGFAVTVVDEREEWAEATRLPGARVLCGTYRELGTAVPRTGAVLVMTHDHALDQDALEWALGERYAFVGGVGSRAKRERTLARLAAKDFPADVPARLRMPLGMSIGARLPDEIAVSIAGEMIAWRRGAERA